MKNNITNEKLKEMQNNTKIIKLNLKEEMAKSFMSYAMAVNISRAIPDVRDGLKPVHRRILYTMGEMGCYSDKPYKKCARIYGEVMGKYHPHGDAAIYDAMVRLTQDFSINTPLIDGHGNFGSIDGDKAAAGRYTEAKLSKISDELLEDINKNTVDFVENYDGTEMQPVVLPSNFPNLLVNGADGIAVGMATNIPPHNLIEVCDGVIKLIDNPEIKIEELIDVIPAPDYPTRGLILGTTDVKRAYMTGRGGIKIRARVEIEEFNNGTRERIVVTELPYQVNKSKLIISIAELVKEKKVDGISDINDESGRNGLRVVIDIKRDHNAQVVLNYLYKHTQLQVSNGMILLALVDNKPRTLNLKEILYYYVEHQKQVIKRKVEFDLTKARERGHVLDGLVLALNDVDRVIKEIKLSSDKVEAIEKLVNIFNFSEIQASAILEMKLQKLTGLEIGKIKEELSLIKEKIIDLTHILENEFRVLDIIKDQLNIIKEKYGVPRKSEITVDYADINIADLIEEHETIISITNDGYIKRQTAGDYKSQNRGGKGISAHKSKEEDYVFRMISAHSHDNLLFFTTEGRVYRLRAYEIPEASRTSRGRAIINILPFEADERVSAVISIKDNQKGSLVMATKNGLIKKTQLENFDNIRKVGKIAIKLTDGDKLINTETASKDDEILVATREGKCIKFKEEGIRATGRNTQGVKAINLATEDKMVDMIIVKKGSQILTISENGYGKRSNIQDYRLQSRAGKGIKAGIFNEQTGKLVNLKQVVEDDDVMIITEGGTIMRTPVQSIRVIGRATKGVKIMKISDKERIVGFDVISNEHIDTEGSLEEN